VSATAENLSKAQAFLETRSGGGGTEMMKAIKASLDPSDSQGHVRIVCFMTDGYVGNDQQIISEVQKHPNARVFAFGIGSSVNRFLLEKMAENGRGEVEFVALNDDGSAAARRFHERVRNPLLTDISVDWNGMPVADVYPQRIPDLFGAKPVILTGRYTAAGRGVIRLRGKMSGREFTREIAVDFPEATVQHDVLAPLWARSRVDDLVGQHQTAPDGTMRPELKEAITGLGLEFRLMTAFTSFVAVEEMIVTEGGQPRRVDVPVEVPEGVNRATVFGPEQPMRAFQSVAAFSRAPMRRSVSRGVIGGAPKEKQVRGGGGGGGVGGANSPAPIVMADAADEVVRVDLTPEEKKRQQLLGKLHPSLVAVVERLQGKVAAWPSEAKFVRDGKAELQVWLTEKSPEALAALRQLGFEVVLDPKTSKLVIGRLPIENLKKLSELGFVRYVVPQNRS